MAKYQILVDDVEKAQAFEHRRYTEAFQRAGASAAKADQLATARIGPPRPRGTVHGELSEACPDGMPNCRNCGDPDFRDACQAAGHCPDCGTRHGIAPSSALTANGFVLKAV